MRVSKVARVDYIIIKEDQKPLIFPMFLGTGFGAGKNPTKSIQFYNETGHFISQPNEEILETKNKPPAWRKQ